MIQPSCIHLIRHGETTGNSSVRYFGSTDIPLSDLGREQVRKHRSFVQTRPLTAIYCSELIRARESAAILLEGSGREAIAHSPFNEVGFGNLEGKTEEEIREQFPEYWQIWRVEKKATSYPGGESFEGFQQRVVNGAIALERNGNWKGEILIVAHRGVIRHLLGHFLKLSLEESRVLAPELGQRISLQSNAPGWSIIS